MRLTDNTDYTLRTLIYLALHPDELVTIQQIAEAYDISRNHLMKIVNELSRRGLVNTVRGRNGGLHLARPAEEINIGAVVRQSEPDFTLTECFDKVNNNCVLTPSCVLKNAMREALGAFFRVLDGYTLADVIANERQIRKLVVIHPIEIRRRIPG